MPGSWFERDTPCCVGMDDANIEEENSTRAIFLAYIDPRLQATQATLAQAHVAPLTNDQMIKHLNI